jgi:hypothetical protein
MRWWGLCSARKRYSTFRHRVRQRSRPRDDRRDRASHSLDAASLPLFIDFAPRSTIAANARLAAPRGAPMLGRNEPEPPPLARGRRAKHAIGSLGLPGGRRAQFR